MQENEGGTRKYFMHQFIHRKLVEKVHHNRDNSLFLNAL